MSINIEISNNFINDNFINDNSLVIFIFNKCNIDCQDLTQLHGFKLERDILLNTNLYNNIKTYIPLLKNVLKTSTYTSTQNTAEVYQKWPLINLIRQLLKKYNYFLIPKRISDGYTKDNVKKYKRFFEIQKIKNLN